MSRPQKSEAAANADDEESFSSERKSLGYYYYAGTCGLCLRLFRIKSYLILFTTQQPDGEVETLLLLVGLTQKNGEREKRGGGSAH